MPGKLIGRALLFVFLLPACGGGGTEIQTSSGTLSNPPAGFAFTDTAGNTLTSFTASQAVQLRSAAGQVLLTFTPVGNVNFTNVVAADTATVTLVHFPSESDEAGLDGLLVLNVPCTAATTQLLVCPNATTAAEVAAGCASAITLTATTASSNSYFWINPTRTSDAVDCLVGTDQANFSTGAVALD